MTACSHLDEIRLLELPRHASRNATVSRHAISAEPEEDWSWCSVDEVMFVVEVR